MLTLENTFNQEIDNIQKYIKELNDLEKLVEQGIELEHSKLEECFDNVSLEAEASDSKTQIQRILDKIQEFQRKRQFFQLVRATKDILTRVRKHKEKYPGESLEKKIFDETQKGLDAHTKSLKLLQKSIAGLKDITNIKERNDKRTLQNWAEHLELFGEELEDNLAFFPTEVLDFLNDFCTMIVLNSRSKSATHEPKKEQWRRRIRYAAGFILNLVERAREDALEEDEEVLQDFFTASQLSFKEIWEDEDSNWGPEI